MQTGSHRFHYSSVEIDLDEEYHQDRLAHGKGDRCELPLVHSCSILALLLLIVVSLGGIGYYHRHVNLTQTVMAIPFEYVEHPMPPSSYWGSIHKPYPTGAFWTNLVVDNGEGQTNSPAAVLPYGVSCTEMGVQISYGATRRVVTQLAITDPFAIDLQLGSVETIKNWSVAKFDNLSVTVQFETLNLGSFTNYLVKSSPFVTVEYDLATPIISSDVMNIVDVNGKLVNGTKGTFYIITLGNYQNWFMYCSEPVSFVLQNNALVAPHPISGVVRVAFIPAQNLDASFSLLAKFVQCYPVSGDVSITYNSDITSTVTFSYSTVGRGELLMLALPHHMDVIALSEDDCQECLKDVYTPIYSLKGLMIPITGKSWNLIYKMETANWNYEVEEDLTISQLNSIADALQNDVNMYLPDAPDPYTFGKQIGRLARLSFIADYLGILDSLSTAVVNLETALTPWLTSKNADTLLYDNTYGGIVSKNGLANPQADYGNGWYNDHHFHYGYFVYAFAALLRFDPNFSSQHRSSMDSIMRDICSMSSDQSDFPHARHKDFFDGHSWASGLFTESNAKNQESSSEATNAYYACYLYASVTGDMSRMRFMQLLYSMEIQSVKNYWHIGNSSSIYDPIFSANTMVGNVGALSATVSTWFGDNPEYVHGINILPVTPATSILFDRAYVKLEWPVLGYFLPTNLNTSHRNTACSSNAQCSLLGLGGDCCPTLGGTYLACCPQDTYTAYAEWLGYMYADHAIVDRISSWDEIMNAGDNFGPGNSKANMLFWAASRSEPLSADEIKPKPIDFNTTIEPACALNSACNAQAVVGMCCPTSTGPGVMLSCCPSVQYPLAIF